MPAEAKLSNQAAYISTDHSPGAAATAKQIRRRKEIFKFQLGRFLQCGEAPSYSIGIVLIKTTK